MNNDQLTTLFGSKTRVKLLRHFLREPGQKYYVRELTRLLEDHINAIRHELSNLESAGLVNKKKSQGKLYYRLDPGASGVRELQNLFSDAVSAAPLPADLFAAPVTAAPAPPGLNRREASDAPDIGDVRLLIQNGKFVDSVEAPADLLIVGNIDSNLLATYLAEQEEAQGELRFTVMTEDEYAYRRQLFDRFITLMLTEPKKVVVNNLRDRQLARL